LCGVKYPYFKVITRQLYKKDKWKRRKVRKKEKGRGVEDNSRTKAQGH
jgi:hypothetical protein